MLRRAVPPVSFALHLCRFAALLIVLAPPVTGAAPAPARETLPGGFAIEFAAAGTPARTDPRFGRRFTRTVVVWGPAGDDEAPPPPRRVASIYYQDADARLAHQTARLCARLLRLYGERFGRPVAFLRGAPEAHVYLCSDDAAAPAREAPVLGGQTWGENVWLFAGREKDAPGAMEWTRTVAHEWGHLTLWPAARGYSEPEAEAAGFLGERLYLKWLREDAGRAPKPAPGPAPDDGVDRAGLDAYYVRQIAPLMARFQTARGGPNAPVLGQTGARAMDHYVGGVLAADDAFGSALVGDALTSVLGNQPQAFFDRLRELVLAAPALSVRLPAWVPLARGAAYRVSRVPTAGVATAAPVRLAIADRPPFFVGGSGAAAAAGGFVVRGEGGWRWARVAGKAPSPLAVRFQRRSSGGPGRP